MKMLINNGKIAPVFFHIREKLLTAIEEKGVEITISGNQTGCDGFISGLGLKYQFVDVDRTGNNPIKDIRTIIDYFRLCKKFQYDVVISYTVKPNIYGSISARLAGIKRIYPTVNGLGYTFTDNGKRTFKQIIIRQVNILLYKIAFCCASKVFFQNPDDARELIQCHAIIRDKCVIIAGSGIDVDKYSYTPVFNTNVFFFASRLLAAKGISTFIEAAKRIKSEYPFARFIVAGSLDNNPDSISVSELNSAISERTIEYLGHISNMYEKLVECSAFILPSYYREGVPHAILEAMSVGRPIITCNTPGCRETVLEADENGKGKNGFLIEPRDDEALYNHIKWLINHPDEVKLMGAESRRNAEEKFNVEKVNSVILSTLALNEE